MTILNPLRELTTLSVLLRLLLSMLLGGMIGVERGKKHRAAGLRTYMLVCLGAALTMILGQYEYDMLHSKWELMSQTLNTHTDISRFGAQVINGIGFLGAGTILVTGRRQVKGLTTAAGLWASACMGLAVGVGFYECVLVVFVLILLCIRLLPRLEVLFLVHSRNMNICIEFHALEDFNGVVNCLRSMEVSILQVELHCEGEKAIYPSVMISLRLHQRLPHEWMLHKVSAVQGVISVEEISF